MLDVTYVDLVDGPDPDLLAELLALQDAWFGEYEYVRDDLLANASLPPLRDGIVHHQTLALVDGKPAGYIVFHTNLRRRVGLGHFMAVDPDFRGRGLAKALEYRAMEVCLVDAAEHGVQLLAYVGEMERHMVPVFESWGFMALPVDYAEPYHGATWSSYGEPTFFDRVLMAHPLEGRPIDVPATSRAGSAAFLLDHYQLPEDHPVVARCVGGGRSPQARSEDGRLPLE